MQSYKYFAATSILAFAFVATSFAQNVGCDHPFDAENAVIGSKPCSETMDGRTGGWGAGGGADGATGDYSGTDQQMAEMQAAACQTLHAELTKQCSELPTAKERSQCTQQANRRTANNCQGPVSTSGQGADGSRNDSYDATINWKARSQALASHTIKPTCLDYLHRNVVYCQSVTNSKVAAACRTLTEQAFESCSVGEFKSTLAKNGR